MIKNISKYKFWFVTGSQDLYGERALAQVEKNSVEIVEYLNKSGKLPSEILFKGIGADSRSIRKLLEQASIDDSCAGVIAWMHTFSPAKMWIAGLKGLTKPLLHFHTQYNREIPLDEIDMDYMNLHQSAHGDREFGFICTRMRKRRKVITGYFKDDSTAEEISIWMRAAVGIMASKEMECVRFGDNMRQVAVTEGDKVEAEIVLGWQVDYVPVGELAEEVSKVSNEEAESCYAEMQKKYDIVTDNKDAVVYQIKLELALRKIMERMGADAFSTNFQDLYGLKQLPGLACQRLMAEGKGFAGEGDWKTACLQAVMKGMEQGLGGGSSFMEDYTYQMSGDGLVLGAHMLEVDPSIGEGRISIDVEPLGIGDREPPARMKFSGKEGRATCVSIIDMGGRLRMIAADVEAVVAEKAVGKMPNLPVAQIMWKPLPNLKTASEA